MVQIDATYKLNWNDYPVMVIGTTDQDHVFHPYAMALCSNEGSDDFEFIFRALHNFDTTWRPSILLADAAEAITVGFTHVFGESRIRLVCFFHVLHNVEKYLKPLSKSGTGLQLNKDIRALQACQDESTFEKAFNLFKKKWNRVKDRRVKDFVSYFEEQWFDKNWNWYEGAALGQPSTNNGIESTNAAIKRSHTLRERLPVGQFLNDLERLITKWSKSRDPNCVNYIPLVLVQIRLKLLDVPPEAKNVPLGRKRKRGRPSIAKRALLVQ